MSRKLLALVIALSWSCGAQAATPAKTPDKPAAKPAPARPSAAKPSATKPSGAKSAGAFNAKDPAGLISVLDGMGAKTEITRTTESEVFLKVSTPAFAFNAQYVGCDAKGKNCQGLAFSTSSSQRKTTLVQLNAFNQTSISCRVFEDQGGKPHVMYSALVSAADTREEMRTHIGVWQGCLSTFGLFLADPIGYLASAP